MAVKVQINTGTLETTLTSDGSPHRAIARASNGRLWVLFRNSAGAVIAAYSDNGGSTWTEETIQAGNGSPQFTGHVVMVDSGDIPHAVWYDAANSRIEYSNRSGGAWAAPTTVHSGAIDYGPWACIDGADDIHVVLNATIAGSTLHYYKRTSGTWGSREAIDASGYAADVIVTTGAEAIVFFWVAAGDMFLRQRVSGVWSARETVSTGSGGGFGDKWPSAAIDSSSNLHVAWSDDFNGNVIRYRRRNSGVWQTERVVATNAEAYNYHAPTLLLDADGDAWVVYQAGPSSTIETIFYKKIVANVVGAEQTLDAATNSPGNHPGVYAGLWQRYNGNSVLAAAGQPFVVVFEEDAGPAYNLYFQAVQAPTTQPANVGTYQIHVDWNNDGDFVDANEDISADVLTRDGHVLAWERGIITELEHVATGLAEFVVKNANGKYSPENGASALSPNVLPGRPIRIRAVSGGTTYNLFKGYIEKYVPRVTQDGQKVCFILCVDGFDRLGRSTIEAPKRGVVTSLLMGQATPVTGVNITFANANPDTITRASGSFITDGFQAGMVVSVAGASQGANNDRFVIATVAATVLTLHSDEALIAEGPSAGVTLTAYGPIGIALDEAGWPQASRSLDAGVDTLDVWFAHHQKTLDVIQALLDGEKSLAYINGAGNFVYEDRHHRLKSGAGGAADHITSQGTFSDTMVEMDYEFSSRTVRNIAVVTGHKRTAAAADAFLWGTRDRPKLEGGGGVTTIWADLDNPCSIINVPAATTDYQISSSPTGSASAALLANVTAVFTKYGQSVKMQFTNNNTQDVYLIVGTLAAAITGDYTLYIDGREYEDDVVIARQEDSTSKTAYGNRGIDVDEPYLGGFNNLDTYAQWLISRYKDPQPDAIRMRIINKTTALLTQQLAREISDRITLTVTTFGISSQDYFVNRMRHEISDGGMQHVTTYELERVDETKYWLLQVTGYGELEEATRQGF